MTGRYNQSSASIPRFSMEYRVRAIGRVQAGESPQEVAQVVGDT